MNQEGNPADKLGMGIANFTLARYRQMLAIAKEIEEAKRNLISRLEARDISREEIATKKARIKEMEEALDKLQEIAEKASKLLDLEIEEKSQK